MDNHEAGEPSPTETQPAKPTTTAENLRAFRQEQYVKNNPHDPEGVMFKLKEGIRDMLDTWKRADKKKVPSSSKPFPESNVLSETGLSYRSTPTLPGVGQEVAIGSNPPDQKSATQGGSPTEDGVKYAPSVSETVKS